MDLFAGLGGWTEGFLAEGWRSRGYDIEAHEYDGERYPGELVIRDILDMHGSEIADADLIVSSSPCTDYSYMAMPWSRAKAKAAAIRADTTGEALRLLNELFDAQFRLQREASEAAGRYIPMVVENVRGAKPWVSQPCKGHYGSYYLWGDVPALLPSVARYGNTGANKRPGRTMCYPAGSANPDAVRGRKGKLHWQDDPVSDGRKNPGFRFDGAGAGAEWFDQNLCSLPSKSPRRKAASARIAKIPFALSSYIARVFRPENRRELVFGPVDLFADA